MYAFALLIVATLTMQLPTESFSRNDLRPLLLGLRRELPSSSVDRLEEVVEAALRTEAGLRPRTHELIDLLEVLAAEATPPVRTYVRFADSARRSLAQCGFGNEKAVLEDLNRDLRVRYGEDVNPSSGEPRATVTCYGQNLEVRLALAHNNPEKLVAVAVTRLQPGLLNRRRQEAHAVPVTLAYGDGTASKLIQTAYEEFEKRRRETGELERVQELFEVGRFILDRQRARLRSLRVRCRVAAVHSPRRHRRQERKRIGAPFTGVIRLQVLDVTPWSSADDLGHDVSRGWADGLNDRSAFNVNSKRSAQFRHFDSTTNTLTVNLTEPLTIDGTIDLELRDHGLEALLNRQEAALRALETAQTTNARLRKLLLEPHLNRVEQTSVTSLVQSHLSLGDEVRDLVSRMLGAEDLFFLQGPPGTGKTTMIAELIAQLLLRHPRGRILLASQAHEAVDNALDGVEEVARTINAGWRIVRDTPPGSEAQGRLDFEQSFRAWVDRVRERSRLAAAREVPTMQPEQRKEVEHALARWREKLDQATDARREFASSVHVLAATCMRVPTVLKSLLREEHFDYAIIDEAARSTPTEALVPMVFAKRSLLVGDHKQLPPFLDHQSVSELREAGIDPAKAQKSLFETLFDSVPTSNRGVLTTQFRMHRSIGEFVGDLYYSDIGGLRTGVSDADRELDVPQFAGAHRVYWVDVEGQPTRQGTSWFNQAELDCVAGVVRQFGRVRQKPLHLAVITPYRAQLAKLDALRLRAEGINITIATVDAFQGKQVDVVVYSVVRDVSDSPFVTDERRLNVAFSRSKRALVIVGSERAGKGSPQMREVLRMIPPSNIVRGSRSDG